MDLNKTIQDAAMLVKRSKMKHKITSTGKVEKYHTGSAYKYLIYEKDGKVFKMDKSGNEVEVKASKPEKPQLSKENKPSAKSKSKEVQGTSNVQDTASS